MKKITLQYTGQLANVAGRSGEMVEVEEGTPLGELVAKVAGEHGTKFSDLVIDKQSGKLHRSLMVVFEGEQADGDLDSLSLDEVENVMLMTPIAGG
ncbi:MAG: hypothetical protein ABF384_07815 [Verrucomicrobiales bacterium]|jgi:molybdopterin converting factor small subunit|nr:hypothetical protein [Verrucomicrobiales bacterium]MDC0251988.1 hypothetical protein [bacterium]